MGERANCENGASERLAVAEARRCAHHVDAGTTFADLLPGDENTTCRRWASTLVKSGTGVMAPASIFNGATTTASAGATLEQILTDFRYIRPGLRRARKPVVILSSDLRDALEFMPSTSGDSYPLQEPVRSGRIMGMDVVSGPHVPAGTPFGLDAAALYVAVDQPRVDLSDAATVLMADAEAPAPTPDGSLQVSDAAAAGAKVVSQWKTYGTALRLVQPCSWGVVSTTARYVTGVTWGA